MTEIYAERWPLLYVELSSEPNDREITEVTAELLRYGSRGQAFALLVDLGRIGPPKPGEVSPPRGLLAARALVSRFRGRCVAQAYVLSWPEARTTLAKLHARAPASWPIRYFGLLGPALQWLQGELTNPTSEPAPRLA